MTPLAFALLAALLVWTAACTQCGYRARPGLFVAVLGAGLALNLVWMVAGLDARAFEPHALIAQASLSLCGMGAFGAGWLVRRIGQAWRESAVS